MLRHALFPALTTLTLETTLTQALPQAPPQPGRPHNSRDQPVDSREAT